MSVSKPMATVTDLEHSYTLQELSLFNVIQHPMWIFDAENVCMHWANRAALRIWRAESLEELLTRDFTDMSPDRAYKLKEYLVAYGKGEVTNEQWTFYPKGIAMTLQVAGSGIRIDGGRLAFLQEAELSKNQTYDDSAIRGAELLRRLPLAVMQFTMEGRLLNQNPEATNVFGNEPKGGDAKQHNAFLGRFVDPKLGDKAYQDVTVGKLFDAEAECHTATGNCWFSISARLTTDPVTSNKIILVLARDNTEILQARKDKSVTHYKSAFMTMLAHDIRTPLHQIVGYMDLLELTDGLSIEQREQIKMVQVSAAALMAIANDLLDYSKLESGKFQLENTSFDLHQLLDGCIDAAKSEAKEKNLSVSSIIASDIRQHIVGDPDRLRQILLNLLSNAVKFTEQGSVTLSVFRSVDDSDTIRFEVKDTGIGIDSEQQAHLFGKYTQANSSVARHYGGTGLGLAICKGLVKAMGGSIALSSEVGQGTLVFFEIALKLPEKQSVQQATQQQVDLVEVEIFRPLNILVAEDNKINQKMVRAMLQRIGHSVTIAENGQLAVDRVERGSFDLVLMDVQMPVMDGIEATKQIRSMGMDKSKLPVVGLTASFQHSELKSYLDIGMNDCLGKPVKQISLKRALAAAVDQSGSSSRPRPTQ